MQSQVVLASGLILHCYHCVMCVLHNMLMYVIMGYNPRLCVLLSHPRQDVFAERSGVPLLPTRNSKMLVVLAQGLPQWRESIAEDC